MLEVCEDRTTPTPIVTAAALADAPEGSAGNRWRLTRDDTSGSLMVNLSFSGTADSGDFTNPMFASFMTGQATADVYLSTNDDGTSEPTETLTLTVASGSGYTIGTPASATINILDNDAQVIWVGVEYAGEDDDEGRVVFNRLGDLSGGLTVNYTVGGTATSGTDYTAIGTTAVFGAGASTVMKTITALPDNLVEGNETVSATVTSGSGYSIGSPGAGTVTIYDAPVYISVEASDTFEGAATGGFSFTRVGGDVSAALTVSYSITGTATSGTDYTALSGSVTFAADEDRVELWVEAFGDNTVDDAETVIATLTGAGTTYELDSGDYIATVTIGDQPLTVSVIALNDGTEGGTNPQLRFSRAGDLSEELTVYYTVSGTATSGTDYTALAGSVTFAEDDDEVDVTVYLSGDSTGEHTETVTVTLDEAEEYLFGNDSDTVFIFDNDTTKVTWTGAANNGLWGDSGNWDTSTVPTQYDDVYFNASGTGNVTNVGDGLTSLYGLHITGTYNGTLTLANGLGVGTFEQTAGTLVMEDEAHDLVVTKALLWSGGTMGATDDGADVVIDDATARIDPPDTGSMSTSSTLRFIGNSLTTFLPGTLNFAGGNGMYIDAKTGFRATPNVELKIKGGIGFSGKISVEADGVFRLLSDSPHRIGGAVTIPIVNQGIVQVPVSVRLEVNGHVNGEDATSPSYLQIAPPAGGGHVSVTDLTAGGAIWTEFGTSFTSGVFYVEGNRWDNPAVVKGDLKVATATVTLGALSKLHVEGNVTWASGKFVPSINASALGKDYTCLWSSTNTFTIGAGVNVEPTFTSVNSAQAGWSWKILEGAKGITMNPANSPPPNLPTNLQENWGLTAETEQMRKWWNIRRKPY